jgi:hypothetical protein
MCSWPLNCAAQARNRRPFAIHRRLRFIFRAPGTGAGPSGNQSRHCFRASTPDSLSAACLTSLGTHCGNRIVTSLCAPDFVCSSRMASKCRGPISSARCTSEAHKRRWTYVILSPSSRQTSTSDESRTARVARKIIRPLGCPHQLPRIVLPATASTSDGTGPRPLSRTTPCASTKASASADDETLRGIDTFYRERGSRLSRRADSIQSGRTTLSSPAPLRRVAVFTARGRYRQRGSMLSCLPESPSGERFV